MTEKAPQRIVVVGTSGSGKSVFARRLATELGISCVELDSLHWEPDWVEASFEVFRERVESATQGRSWVVDGNYGKVRDSIWKKAQRLIWLDYPFHVVFGRALYRTVRRAVKKEVLWSGNRESLRMSFLSKDSILLWVLQTYWRRKREYPALLSAPEYCHLEVLRFRAPKEAEAYLDGLRARV